MYPPYGYPPQQPPIYVLPPDYYSSKSSSRREKGSDPWKEMRRYERFRTEQKELLEKKAEKKEEPKKSDASDWYKKNIWGLTGALLLAQVVIGPLIVKYYVFTWLSTMATLKEALH